MPVGASSSETVASDISPPPSAVADSSPTLSSDGDQAKCPPPPAVADSSPTLSSDGDQAKSPLHQAPSAVADPSPKLSSYGGQVDGDEIDQDVPMGKNYNLKCILTCNDTFKII